MWAFPVNPDRDSIKTRKDALRLVADEKLRGRPGMHRMRKLAVAEEMLRAREATVRRAVDPEDPRWMLALATHQSLQGSMLAFEDRRKVLLLAQRIGIRPFDANLIVAIVQDRARRGEPLEEVAEAIGVVPLPPAKPRPRGIRAAWSGVERWKDNASGASAAAWTWAAAIIVAVVADAILIGWLILR